MSADIVSSSRPPTRQVSDFSALDVFALWAGMSAALLAPLHGLRATPGASWAHVLLLVMLPLVLLAGHSESNVGLHQSARRGWFILWASAAVGSLASSASTSAVSTGVLHLVSLIGCSELVMWATERRRQKLRWAYICGVVLSVGVSLAQTSTLRVRPYGLALRSNELAATCAIALLLLLRAQRGRSVAARLSILAIAAMIGFGLLRSGSRGGLLLFALGSVAYAWQTRIWRRRWVAPLLPMMLLSALLLSSAVIETAAVQRLMGSETSEQADLERSEVNSSAWDVAIDNLPFGRGFDSPERPHSSALRAFLEGGAGGILALGAVFWFVARFRSWLAFSLLIFSLVSTSLWDPWLLLGFFLVLEDRRTT